jgi:hypothetical protein
VVSVVAETQNIAGRYYDGAEFISCVFSRVRLILQVAINIELPHFDLNLVSLEIVKVSIAREAITGVFYIDNFKRTYLNRHDSLNESLSAS